MVRVPAAKVNSDGARTHETSAEFTDLAAGTYELRIEAHDFERLRLKRLPDSPSISLTTLPVAVR